MPKASKKLILSVVEKLSAWKADFPWIKTDRLSLESAAQRRYDVLCVRSLRENLYGIRSVTSTLEKTQKLQFKIHDSEGKHISSVQFVATRNKNSTFWKQCVKEA